MMKPLISRLRRSLTLILGIQTSPDIDFISRIIIQKDCKCSQLFQILEGSMKAMILSASPNEDGLTAACEQAAMERLLAGGAEVEQVCLNHLKIGNCHGNAI